MSKNDHGIPWFVVHPTTYPYMQFICFGLNIFLVYGRTIMENKKKSARKCPRELFLCIFYSSGLELEIGGWLQKDFLSFRWGIQLSLNLVFSDPPSTVSTPWRFRDVSLPSQPPTHIFSSFQVSILLRQQGGISVDALEPCLGDVAIWLAFCRLA